MKKVLFRFILIAPLITIALVWGSNAWVHSSSNDFIFDQTKNVPNNKVGLVLGTAAKTIHGRPNLFFKNRMEAAAALYHAGKVTHLLVSGDNHTRSYNEPEAMREALIKKGVPVHAITLDFAGFRTFDSVVRAKEVFGQATFVVISQPFHNERAIFIARSKGIEAVGFNAKKVAARVSPRTYIREYFARVKAVLDVYVLGTEPKFLGKKELIG